MLQTLFLFVEVQLDARRVHITCILREMIGVIGGSGLQNSSAFQGEEKVVHTNFGDVKLTINKDFGIVFVKRHSADPNESYAAPHNVNYAGIISALKIMEVSKILAICSVGSLKSHIKIGTFVVPDDFFCPYNIRDANRGRDSHHVPTLDTDLRTQILDSIPFREVIDGGVYVNSLGPRFETRAEIRWMAQVGDIIGMTGAHEATIAGELGIPYAILGLVDNMANGLASGLTLDSFYTQQHLNQERLEQAVLAVLGAPATKTTVIHANFIITVNDQGDVLENHAVIVEDGVIQAIVPSANAPVKHCKITNLGPRSVLMPGLVNAHTHSPMVYLRGFGDDLPLTTWLETRIWPAEAKFVSEEFVKEGAELAIAEMILGGTTCFSDMYFFPNAVVEAIKETGIRGVVGAILIDFPTAYAKDADDYLSKGHAMIQGNTCSRVSFSVAPHAPYTVSDANLLRAQKMAMDFKIPIHIHLHESESEIIESTSLNKASPFCHKCNSASRPLEHMNSIGLVNSSLIAVHMTQANDTDIAIMAEKKAHVVHCPSSNLKLASGFCPVQKMIDAGINVAIGTDGASSNNSLNMFEELKLAAILSKGVSKNAESLPAHQAIRMATINGAKALGLEKIIGSIEIGKRADLIAIDLSHVSSFPLYSPVSHIVYSNSKVISHVWVDGNLIAKDGNLTTINFEKLKNDMNKWQSLISQHN